MITAHPPTVLSAGSIWPILLLLGIPKVNVGAIIAMGGILGMIAHIRMCLL